MTTIRLRTLRDSCNSIMLATTRRVDDSRRIVRTRYNLQTGAGGLACTVAMKNQPLETVWEEFEQEAFCLSLTLRLAASEASNRTGFLLTRFVSFQQFAATEELVYRGCNFIISCQVPKTRTDPFCS